MERYSGAVRAAGWFYILATVAGVSSVVLTGPLLDRPLDLAGIAAGEGRILIVALFEFLMAIAVTGVAVLLYPALMASADSHLKQGLVLWYVATRIAEGALFLVGILGLLTLLALSRQVAGDGVPEALSLQSEAGLLLDARTLAYMLGQSIFCVGAVMLYGLMYVARLVPRWLSVWGLIGAPLMLVAGFLVLVDGDPNSPLSTALYLPIALQEMVLAVWLIVRGVERGGA